MDVGSQGWPFRGRDMSGAGVGPRSAPGRGTDLDVLSALWAVYCSGRGGGIGGAT